MSARAATNLQVEMPWKKRMNKSCVSDVMSDGGNYTFRKSWRK